MPSSDNKRIAKNTLLLYVRMLLVIGVTFYTSRVVLDVLGVTDYGLYSLVAGVVVMFAFLNSSMTTCTQRYLCIAIGRGDAAYERGVFMGSIVSHVFISLIFLFLAETGGLWFVTHILNIPTELRHTAVIVYQIAVLTSVVDIMCVPYSGAIVANERMDFYACVSILQSLLKLAILFPLSSVAADKVVLYAILVAAVSIVIFTIYVIYVSRKFANCRVSLRELRLDVVKEMLCYTGWSNFSSVANIGAKQGLGIILNMFFGLAINAAVGIMNQVTAAIYGFITNFQLAVNPPLIKLYSRGEHQELSLLFFRASKFSFYLMIVLSFPAILNMDSILGLWLTDVPEYTGWFCILSLLSLLPNVIGGPVWTIIQASGKIKNYQRCIALVILLNLPLDYLLLSLSAEPYMVLCVTFVLNMSVVAIGMRYVVRYSSIDARSFNTGIVLPCVLVSICAYVSGYFVGQSVADISNPWIGLMIRVGLEVMVIIGVIAMIGMTAGERRYIWTVIRTRI